MPMPLQHPNTFTLISLVNYKDAAFLKSCLNYLVKWNDVALDKISIFVILKILLDI
jgi:hypothetical protein